jgi:hypothetical protein
MDISQQPNEPLQHVPKVVRELMRTHYEWFDKIPQTEEAQVLHKVLDRLFSIVQEEPNAQP